MADEPLFVETNWGWVRPETAVKLKEAAAEWSAKAAPVVERLILSGLVKLPPGTEQQDYMAAVREIARGS